MTLTRNVEAMFVYFRQCCYEISSGSVGNTLLIKIGQQSWSHEHSHVISHKRSPTVVCFSSPQTRWGYVPVDKCLQSNQSIERVHQEGLLTKPRKRTWERQQMNREKPKSKGRKERVPRTFDKKIEDIFDSEKVVVLLKLYILNVKCAKGDIALSLERGKILWL